MLSNDVLLLNRVVPVSSGDWVRDGLPPAQITSPAAGRRCTHSHLRTMWRDQLTVMFLFDMNTSQPNMSSFHWPPVQN